MIKAILFDAGEVLHFSKGSQGDDLKTELGLSDEQISKFYSYYVPRLGKGELTEEQLWSELRDDFGIRAVKPEERLMTHAWEASLQKTPGMYELIDELKELGLKVVLVTNVTPQFAEVLQDQGHYDPFNLRVLSFEIGHWKPENDIYLHALKESGVTPEEAIFIDDMEGNVAAVERLGVRGIVFRGEADLRKQLALALDKPELRK